jgi:hypothetical protein
VKVYSAADSAEHCRTPWTYPAREEASPVSGDNHAICHW